jgi:hypothetical protein
VLVSKVIQNLANGVEFGEKEQHMTKINRFIASNMVCAEAFFEVLSTPPTVPWPHSPHCCRRPWHSERSSLLGGRCFVD